MLALKSYEQNEGFSALNVDELFYINGGSGAPAGSWGTVFSSAAVGFALGGAIAGPTGVGAVVGYTGAAVCGLVATYCNANGW